jgi:hypothetical protein
MPRKKARPAAKKRRAQLVKQMKAGKVPAWKRSQAPMDTNPRASMAMAMAALGAGTALRSRNTYTLED